MPTYKKKRSRLGQQDLQLLYRINDIFIEKNLLQSKNKILTTVSGGQDSTCLITMLHRLQFEWGWKLAVIHCDHGWHSSSKIQGLHVCNLITYLNLDYYHAIATRSINKEAHARHWRYQISQRVAICHNYTKIITGHTASDRIETLLYNLIRGSGVHGLQPLNWKRDMCYTALSLIPHYKKLSVFCSKNIQYRQGIEDITYSKHSKNNDLQLVRPFLSTTRTELKRLCTQWKLPLWSDQSNECLNVNRNRIRSQLLPYLRHFFYKSVDKSLYQLTEIAAAETDYLEALSQHISYTIKINLHVLSINRYFSGLRINLLQILPVSLQRRVLKDFMTHVLKKSISFHDIEKIRLIFSVQFSQKKINLKENSKNTFIEELPIGLSNQIKIKMLDSGIISFCFDKKRSFVFFIEKSKW